MLAPVQAAPPSPEVPDINQREAQNNLTSKRTENPENKSSKRTRQSTSSSSTTQPRLEEDPQLTENSKKRKKSSQATLSSDSQIEINSHQQKEKTKTYYPKIAFDPRDVINILKENYSSHDSHRKSDQRIRRSSRGQSSTHQPPMAISEIAEFSHELIATTLVNQICQQELNGLKSHFSDERYKSKDAITVHLYHLLENLTNSVADHLPADVVFTPELSSRESQQIEQLNDRLSVRYLFYDSISSFFLILSLSLPLCLCLSLSLSQTEPSETVRDAETVLSRYSVAL
jgi:hypothetical protein